MSDKVPAPPKPSPPPSGPAACAASHSSAIQFVDEIGRPLANVRVSVKIRGVSANMKTDGSGILCFVDPPGTNVEISLGDLQELSRGDATKTPSGHHFRAGGTGP